MEEFERSHNWAVCPSCKEEWTKLKTCRFFWNGRWTEDNLCVQCAETPKSIREIARRYPIPEFEIKTGYYGPAVAYSKIGGEQSQETMWRNQYASLKFQNLFIGITATPGGPVLVKIGEDEPRMVDNILAAWSVAEKAVKDFRTP